jgi:UDP-N-acetylmuramoyl-tripeptide--D-alanyl-D-alanine ligase
VAIFKPQEILSWTDGHLLCGSLRRCSGVFTDTRHPLPEGLFVALRGERFDGHDFVAEAAVRGAAGAVIMESEAQRLKDTIEKGDFFLIAVSDTLVALQGLARGHRRRFNGPVIGVTGSNGKTTTKEMIAACLGTEVNVLATYRTLNNEIGVPLTLLALEPQHRICVVEMATRGLGQIAQLAAIAEPNLAVVTNVGPVHLATLGNLDNVARAKAELVSALPASGVAVLNADDSRVLAMQRLTKARVVTYGLGPEADVGATKVVQDERSVRFELRIGSGQVVDEVTVSLPGIHNVSNALAALATGWVCGYDPARAAEALAQLRAAPQRLEITDLPGDILLINDSYNASPLSMRAAIEVLERSPGERRIAVLGDMLELGEQNEHYHREIGQLAAAAGVDLLICIGQAAHFIAAGAKEAGMCSDSVSWYGDAQVAAEAVQSWLREGDSVLVKASRGLRLERVAAAVASWADRV